MLTDEPLANPLLMLAGSLTLMVLGVAMLALARRPKRYRPGAA